jgi:putative transcriptional regulator
MRCTTSATIVTLLVAALALASSSPERDPKKLRPGMLLYAVPGMGDPNFAETVVLLVAHGKSGAMGFAVNRPTRVPLRELLKTLPEAETSELRFHWGGPVEPAAVHALVRTSWPSENARRIVDDVHVTGELADVREALARPDAALKVKLFAGYAGWGGGQLEAEVRAGAWILEPADARSVFAPEGLDIWERVYEILERLEA